MNERIQCFIICIQLHREALKRMFLAFVGIGSFLFDREARSHQMFDTIGGFIMFCK